MAMDDRGVLIFANLAVNVGIDRWHKWFFDALEAKDGAAPVPLIGTIVALVAVGAAFAVGMVRCRILCRQHAPDNGVPDKSTGS